MGVFERANECLVPPMITPSEVFNAWPIPNGMEEPAFSIASCGPTLEGLAYLAFNANQPVRKEKIAAMLWPDRTDKSSRGLLSTALWRIRSCLKPIGSLSLTTDSGCICLTLPRHPEVDVLELETAVTAAHAATQTANCFCLPDCKRQALAGITGTDDREFLEGMTADWILAERERIFNLQVRGLILLMNDLSERGLFEEALMIGRRVLRLDPFRECVHRQVMWLYVLAASRAMRSSSSISMRPISSRNWASHR